MRVGLHQIAELEERAELAQRGRVLGARYVVDRAIELERLGRRQVPEELLLLTEDEHDLLQERVLAPPRLVAVDADLPARRVEQAREDLERRRLSRAVRAEEADALARRDVEVDAVDRRDRLRLASKQRAKSRRHPGRPLVHGEMLAQASNVNHAGVLGPLLELASAPPESAGVIRPSSTRMSRSPFSANSWG